MALKVQNSDGSVSGANAYVSLAEFKSYHDDRGNDYSTFADPKLTSAIIRATDFIDARFNFRGVKQTNGVKAVGVLTGTGNVSLNDSVTINGQTYIFKGAVSQPNYVALGGGLTASLATLVKAINGTGLPGVDYGTGTLPNGDATAVSDSTTLTVTALIGGDSGNLITTTAVSTAASWGATTLTGGSVQTTQFPRRAGSLAFIPFFEPFASPIVFEEGVHPTTFLIGPDGSLIIGIPDALKRATNEYGFRALNIPLLQDAPAPEGGRLIDKHTVKVDVIEETIEYAPSQAGAFAMPAYPAADMLLARAGLIDSGRTLTR